MAGNFIGVAVLAKNKKPKPASESVPETTNAKSANTKESESAVKTKTEQTFDKSYWKF